MSCCECNRLGILVDLAHCTDAAVTDALAIAKAPMVWSHSSVARDRTPTGRCRYGRRGNSSSTARRPSRPRAAWSACWALGADVGRASRATPSGLREMADWLGEDHVAFGTDMNALSKPVIRSYADLRQVVSACRRDGVPERACARSPSRTTRACCARRSRANRPDAACTFGLAAFPPEGLLRDGSAGAETLRLKKQNEQPPGAHARRLDALARALT